MVPVTCDRTEIMVYASTLPMAAMSTGTSRCTTLVVTTGTAPPSPPRPRPRPPPPPEVAAESEQAAVTASAPRLKRTMNERVCTDELQAEVGSGWIRLRTQSPARALSLSTIRAPRAYHLRGVFLSFPQESGSLSP